MTMCARARFLASRAATTLLLVLAAGAARAQTKTGTAMGEFLLIEPSARLAAIGRNDEPCSSSGRIFGSALRTAVRLAWNRGRAGRPGPR